MLEKNTGKLNTPVRVTAEDIVQFLVDHDTIDLSGIADEITVMNIEKYINENHPHRVWQGKNGRWLTYVYDEDAPKHRRLVSKRTKKELLEFLYKDYEEATLNGEYVTLRQVYPFWLEHKRLEAKDTTITRIESDWKKYYANDPIVDEPIKTMNKMRLEDWILRLIREHEMTKTNYYNVSLIIRQIFSYAYYSEMIDSNPFDRVRKDLGKFFKKKKKPSDETQVYTNEEIHSLETLIR